MDKITYDPRRFDASRRTLLFDRLMTQFIKVGGALVITAVFGIFLFILIQILPLFRGAAVKELKSIELPKAAYLALGSDEGSELPFLVREDGKIIFVKSATGETTEVDPGLAVAPPVPAPEPAAETPEETPRAPQTGPPDLYLPLPVRDEPVAAPVAAAPSFSSVNYSAQRQELVFGLSDGRVTIAPLNYSVDYSSGTGQVTQAVKAGAPLELGRAGVPIQVVDFGDAGDSKLIAGIQQVQDQAELYAVRLARKRSLIGGGELKVDRTFNLTPLLSGKPVDLLVASQADGIVVLTATGDVQYFFREGEEFALRQTFQPFGDLEDPTVASMNFLFGDVSLVFTSATGANRVFSLLRPEGSDIRTFVQTKQFPAFQSGATFYSASLRNKAFLLGEGSTASLRYSTTEAVRWQDQLPFKALRAIISGKYDRMLFLDADSRLHLYSLKDPHPETSFRGLFGKVWYEGYSEPRYEWQSTGGSDEFEPKYSLIPLIIGTLKGTFYAMLFAAPIALLAALYTSQFLNPRYRTVVKPTMEIMASLPSVVLGFLAALWLAPLIERHVPFLLLLCLLLPTAAILVGGGFNRLPFHFRKLVPPGAEFIVFFPILLGVTYLAWRLGPAFERLCFVVQDPATGQSIADFRLWWPHVTGARFEQRNSLVVGFMMGFAVIPIIFTIAEDALSNVPGALRSASLALGASRWQTAMRIILPTASAGIFSALMIGLGRAVGETMIVVMATGNTPVMDWDIFSGMRTLSANIAVELPEAPHHGTLYRTLFLGAMLLFLMTFLVNTVAELLRQHLREKYKTV